MLFSRFGLLFFLAVLWNPAELYPSWNRNESHLNWKVSETEHFRVYYDKSLETVAEYTAAIAEDVYLEKTRRFGVQLPGKVELIIKDDIFSNGWALSYQNTMQIWVTDWDIPFRSTHNWLRDVVTHEFSHLVSIQAGSKLHSSIFGLVLGYQDYFNEPIQTSVTTLVPFSNQPNWFAEGVAQYESDLSGHDSWDSHRDMIMRVAVLEDSLLSYDRMGTFAGKSLHFEQGPYTQGYSFVRYLANRFGDEAVRKLWIENAKIYRQTLSGAMKRMWGQTGPQLWADWQREQKKKYKEQVTALGEQVVGTKITKGSFYNDHVRWNADGTALFFISNKGRQSFRGKLVKYDLADSLEEEDREKKKNREKIEDGGEDEDRWEVITGAIRGRFDLRDDDTTFLYASARDKNNKGEARWDVYETDVYYERPFWKLWGEDGEKRLTEYVNGISPSYSSDYKKAAFVRGKASNFQLYVTDVNREKATLRSARRVYPPEGSLEGKFGQNLYTPVFQPGGDRILFSLYDGESRKIAWVKEDGSGFEVLLDRPWDDRDPYWHPDGKSFVFSSDSTGIYNIYRFDINTRNVERITNVSGGAFSPALSRDGKHLAYTNYDVDGFSIYTLKDWKPLKTGDDSLPARAVRPDSTVINPLEFSGTRQKYLSLPNRFILQPIIYGQEITAADKQARGGDAKWLAGVTAFLNDPVRKNELTLGLLLELGNGLDYFGAHSDFLEPDKESEAFAGWWNHSLPVSFGLSYVQRNLVTFDTIVEQSVSITDEDSSYVTNHAIKLKNAQASLRYNLFPGGTSFEDPFKQTFLMLNAGYAWNDFNFYEIPFDFTFYKSTYFAPILWFYGVAPTSKSIVAPVGLAAYLGYTLSFNQLIREGTFRETFTFEDGVLRPNFRDFRLQELDVRLDYGLSLPWSRNSSLRFSGQVGSILDWQAESAGADTLDSFFQRGLFLRAYPYLENTEELFLRGENTLVLGADLNQVLWGDIFKQYWILFVEDIYATLFWEAGRAWDGKLGDPSTFRLETWDAENNSEGWYQSVGFGFKLNSRIYHNYPAGAYLEFSRAVNQVRTRDGRLVEIPEVSFFGIPTPATRIHFGISLGFYNGLLGGNSSSGGSPVRKARLPQRGWGG